MSEALAKEDIQIDLETTKNENVVAAPEPVIEAATVVEEQASRPAESQHLSDLERQIKELEA